MNCALFYLKRIMFYQTFIDVGVLGARASPAPSEKQSSQGTCEDRLKESARIV